MGRYSLGLAAASAMLAMIVAGCATLKEDRRSILFAMVKDPSMSLTADNVAEGRVELAVPQRMGKGPATVMLESVKVKYQLSQDEDNASCRENIEKITEGSSGLMLDKIPWSRTWSLFFHFKKNTRAQSCTVDLDVFYEYDGWEKISRKIKFEIK